MREVHINVNNNEEKQEPVTLACVEINYHVAMFAVVAVENVR